MLALGLLAPGGAVRRMPHRLRRRRLPRQAEEPAVVADDPAPPSTMDHLELDPTSITGNRELPKVMVIVPWKRADLGDLTGRPANSLLNEVLAPVDREVFRRELRYFEALEAKPET